MSHTKSLVDETINFISSLQEHASLAAKNTFIFRIMKHLLKWFNLAVIPQEHLETLQLHQRAPIRSINMFWELVSTPESFDPVFDLLEDQESKELLARLIKVRTAWPFLGAGAFHYFPAKLTQSAYISAVESSKERAAQLGLPAKYVALLWVLNHYTLSGVCEVTPGDIVLDVGAFRGDSALYFSEKCAPHGSVYALEAVPAHLEDIKRISKKSKSPIIPLPLAAWNKRSDLYIDSSGGTSNVNSNHSGLKISADTIDNIVDENRIQRIDFIKMDIEGAEQYAINGAVNTIKKFKPKLAISVYHLPDDLYKIPQLLHSYNPYYKFYLRQYHPRHDETVLYAVNTIVETSPKV